MKITEKKEGDMSVIRIDGRLDSNTSPEFEEKLCQSIEDGVKRIILDFEALGYISSAGLRVILKTAKNLKKDGGKLVLCAMQDYVKEIFEISGFDTFLPIVPSVEEALKQV